MTGVGSYTESNCGMLVSLDLAVESTNPTPRLFNHMALLILFRREVFSLSAAMHCKEPPNVQLGRG